MSSRVNQKDFFGLNVQTNVAEEGSNVKKMLNLHFL
jgi:hypothetical protein